MPISSGWSGLTDKERAERQAFREALQERREKEQEERQAKARAAKAERDSRIEHRFEKPVQVGKRRGSDGSINEHDGEDSKPLNRRQSYPMYKKQNKIANSKETSKQPAKRKQAAKALGRKTHNSPTKGRGHDPGAEPVHLNNSSEGISGVRNHRKESLNELQSNKSSGAYKQNVENSESKNDQTSVETDQLMSNGYGTERKEAQESQSSPSTGIVPIIEDDCNATPYRETSKIRHLDNSENQELIPDPEKPRPEGSNKDNVTANKSETITKKKTKKQKKVKPSVLAVRPPTRENSFDNRLDDRDGDNYYESRPCTSHQADEREFQQMQEDEDRTYAEELQSQNNKTRRKGKGADEIIIIPMGDGFYYEENLKSEKVSR